MASRTDLVLEREANVALREHDFDELLRLIDCGSIPPDFENNQSETPLLSACTM